MVEEEVAANPSDPADVEDGGFADSCDIGHEGQSIVRLHRNSLCHCLDADTNRGGLSTVFMLVNLVQLLFRPPLQELDIPAVYLAVFSFMLHLKNTHMVERLKIYGSGITEYGFNAVVSSLESIIICYTISNK